MYSEVDVEKLTCVKCGSPRNVGRRICQKCNKERLLKIVLSKPRYVFTNECKICFNAFQAWRKNQRFCKNCNALIEEVTKEYASNNNYSSINSETYHRKIAIKLVGRDLNYDEIVHHLDGNSQNNEISNLIVMCRKDHVRLHIFLNRMRAYFRYYDIEKYHSQYVLGATKAWFKATGSFVVWLENN